MSTVIRHIVVAPSALLFTKKKTWKEGSVALISLRIELAKSSQWLKTARAHSSLLIPGHSDWGGLPWSPTPQWKGRRMQQRLTGPSSLPWPHTADQSLHFYSLFIVQNNSYFLWTSYLGTCKSRIYHKREFEATGKYLNSITCINRQNRKFKIKAFF